jgi:phage terminase small subunit
MPKGAKLQEKQRRFVEAYTGPAQGNATEAARMVGYKHPTTQGPRLLENVGVAEAIQAATSHVRSAAIATREERQELLTAMMRGEVEDARPSDRLKATEILGKMQGDFIEKHHVTHEGTARVVFYPDNTRGPAPADG